LLVRRRKARGNQQLKDVYDNIANTESEVTFGEGYSLAVASGDLTNNASYSEYWADLFTSCKSLWNHVPLLTSIGNHDYYCSGIGRGQMIGGLEEDCRFFHRFITNPSSGKGILPGHWYSVDQGNVHLVFLDTNGPRWGKYPIDCDSEQWHWLKNDLKEWRERVNKNEKAPQFCVVVFHSAIISEGYWGSGFNWGNDEKVQSYLLPLFKKYGVDLALFGHAHIYQRSEWQDTQFVVNGRSGGTLRFSQIFAERRTIYDIHRLYSGRQMKTYVTLYIPPNKAQMTDKEKEVFKHFKGVLRNDLLTQPIAHNYFFGVRKINSKIGELIDKDEKLKASFIDEIILSKLDDHLWLRTYSVEEHFDPRNREIIDLAFIKAKLPKQYQPEKYDLLCPGKVID
jgi:hypothetical protein